MIHNYKINKTNFVFQLEKFPVCFWSVNISLWHLNERGEYKCIDLRNECTSIGDLVQQIVYGE